MKGALIWLLLLMASLRAEAPFFEFTKSAGTLEWAAANDVGELRASAEGLVVPVTGGDPYITGPRGNYRSEKGTVFVARVKSPVEGWGQVFYFKDVSREQDSAHFRLRAGWNDVAVPLPAMGDGWRLRLDFPGQAGESVVAWAGVQAVEGAGVGMVTEKDGNLLIEVHGKGREGPPANAQRSGPDGNAQRPMASENVEVVELLPHQSYRDHWEGKVVQVLDLKSWARVQVPRRDGGRDGIYSGFLARTAKDKRPLGLVRYVENAGAAAQDQRAFVEAANKKGLQFQMVDDALALGIKHATINVSLTGLLDLSLKPGNPTWEVDGRTYAFHRGYLESLPVRQLSNAGVTVYFILLAHDTGPADVSAVMLHPDRQKPAPNRIAAFNTATEDGTRALRAVMEFLADRYSRADDEFGRVSGYIVGNEINAHWQWYNFGKMPDAGAVAEYEKALRTVHTAVRSASANARVYCSLTHHWTARPGPHEMGSKFFLEHLARLSRAGGDYDWQVAFHPYPENLFEPRFWKDKSARNGVNTPRVTFRNLPVLVAALGRAEMQYRGKTRSVILSEQGFHSDGTPAGDEAQAAAFCLAWETVAKMPEIEAFILHRHVDHKMEGGLNLGLWTRKGDSVATPDRPRKMYECFKAAGTEREAEVFGFAKDVVGK